MRGFYFFGVRNMDTVLLVIHLLVAVSLVCVILMQRSSQDGGGLMGGSSTMGGLFTARGSANLLSRTTAVLATAFILLSLVLGIMASQRHETRSLVDQVAPLASEAAEEAKEAVKTEPEVPVVPTVPAAK